MQVNKALEDVIIAKANVEAIIRILAACASLGAHEEVSGVAVSMLHKHEHVAPLLAQMVEFCSKLGDLRLPQQILQDLLVKVDPGQYKEMSTRQSGGVAFVARFLTEIAERCVS